MKLGEKRYSAEEYIQSNIDLLGRLDHSEYIRAAHSLSGAFMALKPGHSREDVLGIFRLALAALGL